jgi:hypothetical protein
MIKDPSASVRIDPDEGNALLKVKKSLYKNMPAGTQETYASALHARAVANKIHTRSPTHYVVEVAVAVPAKVPREIDRYSVTRLGMLGEGESTCGAGGADVCTASVAHCFCIFALSCAVAPARATHPIPCVRVRVRVRVRVPACARVCQFCSADQRVRYVVDSY